MSSALSASTDTNPHLVDLAALSNCSIVDGVSVIGAKLTVGGQCFENCHPDLLSVYDFSTWSVLHPGNDDQLDLGNPHPIAGPAEINRSAAIQFPSWHTLSRWETGLAQLSYLGRLGDEVDFRDLPTGVQTLAMAQELGAVGSRPDDGFESCGSPGEVANVPSSGHRYIVHE